MYVFAVKLIAGAFANWGTHYGLAKSAAEAAEKALSKAQKSIEAEDETLSVESVTRLGPRRF